jgi:hypothetical protein
VKTKEVNSAVGFWYLNLTNAISNALTSAFGREVELSDKEAATLLRLSADAGERPAITEEQWIEKYIKPIIDARSPK